MVKGKWIGSLELDFILLKTPPRRGLGRWPPISRALDQWTAIALNQPFDHAHGPEALELSAAKFRF